MGEQKEKSRPPIFTNARVFCNYLDTRRTKLEKKKVEISIERREIKK